MQERKYFKYIDDESWNYIFNRFGKKEHLTVKFLIIVLLFFKCDFKFAYQHYQEGKYINDITDDTFGEIDFICYDKYSRSWNVVIFLKESLSDLVNDNHFFKTHIAKIIADNTNNLKKYVSNFSQDSLVYNFIYLGNNSKQKYSNFIISNSIIQFWSISDFEKIWKNYSKSNLFVLNYNFRYKTMFKNQNNNSNYEEVIFSGYCDDLVKLFNQNKENLFWYNFPKQMYYKSTDEQLIKLINNNSNNFYFLNNGITIACDNFFITENKKIIINNFSIISGGEYVYLLDNKNILNNKNASILIRVIKLKEKDSIEGNFFNLIGNLINSRKEINPRDMRARSPEMIKLKSELNKFNICLNVWGEKNNSFENNTWKYIDNDLFAQIFLATLLQQPAVANQNKLKIFQNDSLYYNQIFKNNNYHTIDFANIIFNHYILDIFIDNFIKQKSYINSPFLEKIELLKRLKFWIEGVFSIFSKCYFQNNLYLNDKENLFNIYTGDILKININCEAIILNLIEDFMELADEEFSIYKKNKTRGLNTSSFSYNSDYYKNIVIKILKNKKLLDLFIFNMIGD